MIGPGGSKTSSALDREVGPKATKGNNVWRVTFYPGKGVQVGLLDDEAVKEVQNKENRVGFLPKTYWDTWLLLGATLVALHQTKYQVDLQLCKHRHRQLA